MKTIDERPHVLLVTVDHWPGNLLGCAGHPEIRTPTLDALARGGVRFTNAYSECPVCIPARRSLMTGTAPSRSGFWYPEGAWGGRRRRRSVAGSRSGWH